MARCLGAHPAYGCGHFKEHQEAARKGWKTRRAAPAFKSEQEHAALSALFGGTISHAHEHPEHAGMVRFKEKSKWYELPRKEWSRLIKEGYAVQREQAREQRAETRQKKQLQAVRKAEYQSVVRAIRASGGIRPYRRGINGKVPEKEEWNDLPRAVKTLNPRGMALDDMADELSSQFPWLYISRGDDLATYLQEQHRRLKSA